MSGSGRSGFLAGLVAGAVITAAIYFGLLTGGVPAVALALWERWMRLVPLPLFSLLIVRLKFVAKPAAFWGMLAALVLAGGVVGTAVARWVPSPAGGGTRARSLAGQGVASWAAVSGLLVLVAYQPAAAYLAARRAAEGATDRTEAAVLGAIAGYGLVFAILYMVLMARSSWPRRPTVTSNDRTTRRALLSRAIVLIVASAAGASAARWLETAARKLVIAAESAFAKVRGLPPEITANDQFYIVSKNPPGFDPIVDATKWSLQVGGLVGNSLRLSYDELRAMPSVEQFQTLECISNEIGGDLISTAKWRGVRLRDVLLRAGGPGAKAVKVAFRCADGYTESIPIGDAMNPTTLLTYEMNGEPLPPKHGFPVRLLIPGLYGMKNPKWITAIEVVDYDFQGYWERSGWSDEAVVKTMSKFTDVIQPPSSDEISLGGVAYAGDRGIREVEYSADGGKSWQKTETKSPLGPFTWVLWAAVWKPDKPGQYTLKLRAKDGGGVLQPAKETPTLPDGASGYHALRVRVSK